MSEYLTTLRSLLPEPVARNLDLLPDEDDRAEMAERYLAADPETQADICAMFADEDVELPFWMACAREQARQEGA